MHISFNVVYYWMENFCNKTHNKYGLICTGPKQLCTILKYLRITYGEG